jgi:hypothetical protein
LRSYATSRPLPASTWPAIRCDTHQHQHDPLYDCCNSCNRLLQQLRETSYKVPFLPAAWGILTNHTHAHTHILIYIYIHMYLSTYLPISLSIIYLYIYTGGIFAGRMGDFNKSRPARLHRKSANRCQYLYFCTSTASTFVLVKHVHILKPARLHRKSAHRSSVYLLY